MVRVQNGDVWLIQKAITQLFDVDRSVITKHLKNVIQSKEQTGDIQRIPYVLFSIC